MGQDHDIRTQRQGEPFIHGEECGNSFLDRKRNVEGIYESEAADTK